MKTSIAAAPFWARAAGAGHMHDPLDEQTLANVLDHLATAHHWRSVTRWPSRVRLGVEMTNQTQARARFRQ